MKYDELKAKTLRDISFHMLTDDRISWEERSELWMDVMAMTNLEGQCTAFEKTSSPSLPKMKKWRDTALENAQKKISGLVKKYAVKI